MSDKFKLHDTVLARIVQILQEALLTGTDVADIMRLIEVEDNGDGTVSLTKEYRDLVNQHHQKMLADIEKIKSEKNVG